MTLEQQVHHNDVELNKVKRELLIMSKQLTQTIQQLSKLYELVVMITENKRVN